MTQSGKYSGIQCVIYIVSDFTLLKAIKQSLTIAAANTPYP